MIHLDGERVRECLSEARNIAEQYRLYVLNPDPNRSIDDLTDIVGKNFLGKDFVIRTLRPKGFDELKAFCFVYDNRYEIYLTPDLAAAPDMRKFALCKELFHVVLDHEACRTIDMLAHLQDFLIVGLSSPGDGTEKSPTAQEMYAEIAAMEFLFPYKDRVELTASDKENGGLSRIVGRYGIPQYLIEKYCHPAIMAMLAPYSGEAPALQVIDGGVG